ncbi:MAG TPA: tRNA epoxyqueuosine(34) reductase QueG [Pirellulaceae bacterium]|nr:tRNA epoxyqueuosine(34) reductase QueG [Pirellulaceae bacterium]
MDSGQPEKLTDSIKSLSRKYGFQFCGVAPAVSPTGYHRFVDWIAAGNHGEMSYLQDRLAAYSHPASILAEAKSIVMLGMNYYPGEAPSRKVGFGRVARYAWGTVDYHDLIKQRLRMIEGELLQVFPNPRLRSVVDTAPLLEREFAQLAGIGWIGKNTMLINKRAGSYFFLAALLIDQEMKYDEPNQSNHCGTCRACLEACPTQAFPEPGVLDATRCISYLTIEHRTAIPEFLRDQIGDWLFGCDVCQEVCPWNRFSSQTSEEAFSTDYAQLDLEGLLAMTEEEFRRVFRRTPMWRAKRRGMLRNAVIALLNNPPPNAVRILGNALNDNEPLVREMAAWAMGRLRQPAALPILQERQLREGDEATRSAIQNALEHLQAASS